jgi:hypothetical protein
VFTLEPAVPQPANNVVAIARAASRGTKLRILDLRCALEGVHPLGVAPGLAGSEQHGEDGGGRRGDAEGLQAEAGDE